MSSVASSLIASLVDSPEGLSSFIKFGLGKEMFRGPEEVSSFDLMQSFVLKYGALPARSLFEEKGIHLPEKHEHPTEYYFDQLKTRYVHYEVKQAVIDAQELLNADNPLKAKQIITDAAMRLTVTTNKRKIVNYQTEGKDMIFNAMKAKKLQGDDYGIKFGWPTLDAMSDGLMGGDLVTIVGRPGQGKTYGMLFTAEYSWDKQGKVPMFVTMEMKPLPISQRIAAVNAKKSITQLKKAELSSAAEKDLLVKMEAYSTKVPFWIVDGALTATVDDIILMARQLKPDVVWIDGAYLVKGDDPRQQRWDRTTTVLEKLKGGLAESLDIPVIISFQFNRQQKKGQEGSLDNIAFSDAVGQLSSVILGLGLSEDENSVESLYRRKVDVLKGRNGEIGSFDINWRFDLGPNYMDFTEAKTIQTEDLAYGAE